MNLDTFFNPKSIAIIGASATKGSIGYVELENFVNGNYKGKMYPVNPHRKKILGKKCYKSILDIENEIDLAIIVTPGKVVPFVLDECGKKKVKAALIISAGFAEIGEIELTEKLEKVISKYKNKMNVIGPNVLGHLYMKNGVDTLFNPPYRSPRPKNGGISFVSQSGALGAAMLDWAAQRGYGINKFVSYGNAMHIDEADLLEYLGNDKDTKVIAMYVEGVKNGRKFFKIAKKVTKKKPVVFIKGGLTKIGNAATQSHTGSLAGNIEVYKAMFKQTGIIEAHSLKQLFNFAKIFITEPYSKGERVQIITNGGGFGVLSVDAILNEKLILAKPSKKTQKTVRKVSPKYAIMKNPMDLTGDANNKRYTTAIKACLNDKNIDAILLILLFQVPTLDENIDKDIKKVLKNRKKPVVIMAAGGTYSQQHKKAMENGGMSTFASPFEASKALAALIKYCEKNKW